MAASDAAGSGPDERAWEEFCERVRRAGRRVIEAAPDDPLDRAEGLRYVGRITRHALASFIEQSDPAAPAVTMGLPKLGGDNPDYVYASAPVSGRFEYRLRGNTGDARYLGIGTYSGDVGTAEGLRLTGYRAGAELAPDAHGDFELVLSCREQPGAWLPMQPGTTQLMIRQTLLDRRRQRHASFAIERCGATGGAAPFDPARYAAQLERAGRYVDGAIAQFLEWTRSFALHPNEIGPLDPKLADAAQGDPRTHYHGGYFAVAEDEVLLVDFRPPECDYWNLQLCNHWLESLDFEHHTVAVNDHGAVRRPDGSVRIAIADADPGVPNWLDTAGHRRGGLFLRQVGTDAPSRATCTLVRRSAMLGEE
jgi:hypothetical protein